MVEWLGGYLQQLIIIILIATFLELLLPNTTFERYVRLVMGLLVLFLIMKPAFSLFNNQINWERWLVVEGEETILPSLTEIQADADKLKRDQTEFMHKQFSEQIEQQTKTLLSKRFKVNTKEVVATVEEADDRPKIKELRIELSSDEVLCKGQSDAFSDLDGQVTDKHDHESKLHVDREKIATYLLQYWGLEDHQLQVLFQ